MRSLSKLLGRPRKQYTRKIIEISLEHDLEIKLLQAAIKERTGSFLSYSQLLAKMIDEFLEKMDPNRQG